MAERAMILPPLRRTAADAANFASIVHEGQTDKAGRPYVEHLARVQREAAREMVRRAGFDVGSQEVDEARQIAWLHDTIEDTDVGPSDLRAEGFAEPVVSGVLLLTSIFGSNYDRFIRSIVENSNLAVILVKLADVTDNSDPDRLALLPEADRDRLTRNYAGAKEALQAAARAKGWRG